MLSKKCTNGEKPKKQKCGRKLVMLR